MLVNVNNVLSYISSDSTPALSNRDILLLKNLILEVEGYISAYLGYEINEHNVTEILKPYGTDLVFLSELAQSIQHVFLDSTRQFTPETEITDKVELDQKLNAVRYLEGNFPCSNSCVKVEYTVGWTADTVPKELKSIIAGVAASLFEKIRKKQADVMTHAGLGSSVTYPVEKFFLPHHYTILSKYRIPAI